MHTCFLPLSGWLSGCSPCSLFLLQNIQVFCTYFFPERLPPLPPKYKTKPALTSKNNNTNRIMIIIINSIRRASLHKLNNKFLVLLPDRPANKRSFLLGLHLINWANHYSFLSNLLILYLPPGALLNSRQRSALNDCFFVECAS